MDKSEIDPARFGCVSIVYLVETLTPAIFGYGDFYFVKERIRISYEFAVAPK